MPAPDCIALLLLFKRRDGERSLASAAIITHLRPAAVVPNITGD